MQKTNCEQIYLVQNVPEMYLVRNESKYHITLRKHRANRKSNRPNVNRVVAAMIQLADDAAESEACRTTLDGNRRD